MGMAQWPEKERGSITEQHARRFIKNHPKGRRLNFKDTTEDLREAVMYMEALCDELAHHRARCDPGQFHINRKIVEKDADISKLLEILGERDAEIERLKR